MFTNIYLETQYACCLVQFIIWFLPVLILRYAMIKAPLGINNSNPRDQYNTLPDYAVRASHAHTNTLEGFVWFGFGLLMNYIGKGDHYVASILAIMYTTCRVIYLPLFIFDLPTLRTAVWNLGFLVTFSLLILPFAS